MRKVKIKTELIVFFFYNGKVEPFFAKVGTAFKIYYPFMLVQKLSAVHGHYHFCIMPHAGLVFGECANHIAKAAGFGYGVTFGANVNYFHWQNIILKEAVQFMDEIN